MVDQKKRVGNPDALRSSIEVFYFAYREFTARPDRILERRGLGRLHHRILYFIGRNRSITVTALLTVLRVSKQALNLPLRQLIEMKLVDVEVPAQDRRLRLLSLTGEGGRLETLLTTTQTKHLADAFAVAGGDATEGWHKVMQRIASATETEMQHAT